MLIQFQIGTFAMYFSPPYHFTGLHLYCGKGKMQKNYESKNK